MPDQPAAEEIRAAGAVPWRPAGAGVQAALVHRPKYDDWSFPKGKVDQGEHVILAAVREVFEATGMQVTLGLRLLPVRYLVDGQPKVVDYWAAAIGGAQGEFAPNKEVDRMEWVAVSRAAARLSYDHDAALLADFSGSPRPTVPLILVRHASAGNKSDWRKADAARPLDARGKQQAKMLARLLRCFGAGRVLSSPAERCLATVRPFADQAGLTIEAEPAFGVADAGRKKSSAAAAAAGELADSAACAAATAAADSGPVVICAHRENLPLILSAACKQLGASEPDEPPMRKGGFLVLHRTAVLARGNSAPSASAFRLAGAERHHPEDGQLPASVGRRLHVSLLAAAPAASPASAAAIPRG